MSHRASALIEIVTANLAHRQGGMPEGEVSAAVTALVDDTTTATEVRSLVVDAMALVSACVSIGAAEAEISREQFLQKVAALWASTEEDS